ncbi:hypothetical protein CASFOL_026212 [Castilleja foliolosa]|uniref:Uncharacterized protein n=1 Tax=Castilleja foliolosa TaxID=1961234 RepID=A0ABD3CJ01_9LAMI
MGTRDELCKEEANELSPSLSPPSSSSIVPLTPDSSRENVEQRLEFSSPLTVMVSTPELNNNSSQTPKEALFDSFAPGPDKCVLAPHHNKYKGKESRIHVVRRLNFTNFINSVESSMDIISDDEDEEHYLFRIVYGALLDAIVLEQQTKQIGVVPGPVGPGTPKSAPHLSWIAKTCPGAPIKSSRKLRNIDEEICKKLEF